MLRGSMSLLTISAAPRRYAASEDSPLPQPMSRKDLPVREVQVRKSAISLTAAATLASSICDTNRSQFCPNLKCDSSVVLSTEPSVLRVNRLAHMCHYRSHHGRRYADRTWGAAGRREKAEGHVDEVVRFERRGYAERAIEAEADAICRVQRCVRPERLDRDERVSTSASSRPKTGEVTLKVPKQRSLHLHRTLLSTPLQSPSRTLYTISLIVLFFLA